MLKYIIQRIGAMLLTLFVILTLGFFMIRLMPGSPYDDPNYTAEIIAMLEKQAHLDEPIHIQYYYFLRNIIVDGNWGVSLTLRPGVPVFQVLADRIPVTLVLNVLSLLISIPLGLLAGTTAALNKSKLPDHILSILVVLCISVPSFVFATLLQYVVAFLAGLAPTVYQATGPFLERLPSLVLPVLALSFGSIATLCRYLRGELIENVNSEYMLLAKTKGLGTGQSITRHAFRNSMVPMANIIIPMFTNVMGGSLVVEKIFSIPGVGGIMVNSINNSDHWLTLAILMFYSVITLVTMLIVDISYGLIDPRIRLGGK